MALLISEMEWCAVPAGVARTVGGVSPLMVMRAEVVGGSCVGKRGWRADW